MSDEPRDPPEGEEPETPSEGGAADPVERLVGGTAEPSEGGVNPLLAAAEAPEEPRRLPPVALPVIALTFMLIMVFSFSRILLAVSVTAAPIIALLVAINVLVGAALIAVSRRVRGRRPAAFPLLLGAGALVVVGGAVALAVGQPKEEAKTQVAKLEAKGIAFIPTEIALAPDARIDLEFDNQDAGVQHNVHIFQGADASGKSVFSGEIVTGAKATHYAVPALLVGAYFFHCDIHPEQMKGTIDVKEGAGPPSTPNPASPNPTVAPSATPSPSEVASPTPPVGGGRSVDLVAKGTAFDPTTLSVSGGGTVTVHFDNQDPLPHNLAIFEGTDATGKVIFRGDIVTGPAQKDYAFEAPPPGTYFFHCDVHPDQMKGSITFK